ncbi:unnamed protein product [Rotaria sp. Silwood1]|nr:unnamed protein product [Rotaria sp. Silwood1]CAF1211496.1 unnamed protein product [Rotaria sp. Silwood1]
MKDYSSALEYFEKCLAIVEPTLPKENSVQAVTLSCIGHVHQLMGNYEKALSFHQKALIIQETSQYKPLDCATTYTNLGETYREIKDYSTALTYFQKALEICEKTLPKTHPRFAIIYHNLAKLYLATGQYDTAMKNAQQSLEIVQDKLPSSHPHVLDYKETFERIKNKLEICF